MTTRNLHLFLAASLSLSAQQSDLPQWQIAAGNRMEFEVASIKPRAPNAPFIAPLFPLSAEDGYTPTGGRFVADFNLQVYIQFAYKIWPTREQWQVTLDRLPKWVSTEDFIITAKAPIGSPTKDQMRIMMQSLLADRFHLAVHFETQDTPVLALTLSKQGKTGPELKPHAEGPPCDVVATPDVFPGRCDSTYFERHPGTGNIAGSRNATLEFIARALPSLGRLERPVVDQTGLSGRFDYKIQWTPDPATPADEPGTTFMQALDDQLGLKLKSTRAPMRILVIDRIERPTGN